MYRLAEASDFLRKWIESLPADDPLQLPAGLLLGEALYAQGSSNPGVAGRGARGLRQAARPRRKTSPPCSTACNTSAAAPWNSCPTKRTPRKSARNRRSKPIYSVLETTTPPQEWEYFELCGFRALALLEKAERWQAAIACRQKNRLVQRSPRRGGRHPRQPAPAQTHGLGD